MDRREELLKGISKSQIGVEIGPYHAPLAPRRLGYNCLSLDVWPTDVARERAKDDPCLTADAAANIEDVDLVGEASEIETLVKARLGEDRVDYILSSHNFEHLPNPIRFLQGCHGVLKPGGVLSMAIPDHRCCFDYFRPVSTIAEVLEAYFSQRVQPTDAQIFLSDAYRCNLVRGNQEFGSFDLSADGAEIRPIAGILQRSFSGWVNRRANGHPGYCDAHCWAFTPAAFELLMLDLRQVGLLALEVEEVSPAHGNEFYVRLRKPLNGLAEIDPVSFETRRSDLLQRMVEERTIIREIHAPAPPAPAPAEPKYSLGDPRLTFKASEMAIPISRKRTLRHFLRLFARNR